MKIIKKSEVMLEIERKYLLKSMDWLSEDVKSTHEIQQAYLFQGEEKSLRIRLKDTRAYLTIKMGKGISRHEFEFEIPQTDAIEMIQVAELKSLRKTRYEIQFYDHIWEIDVFKGKHDGLILAEIELTSEDERFAMPHWLGEEVTHDPNYLNVNLFKTL